jgi:hypothetical protein
LPPPPLSGGGKVPVFEDGVELFEPLWARPIEELLSEKQAANIT